MRMLKTSDSNNSNRTLPCGHMGDAAHGDKEMRGWNPGVPGSQVLAVSRVLSAAGVPPGSQRGLRSSLACGKRGSKKKKKRELELPETLACPSLSLGDTGADSHLGNLLDTANPLLRSGGSGTSTPSSSCPLPTPPGLLPIPWCRCAGVTPALTLICFTRVNEIDGKPTQ